MSHADPSGPLSPPLRVMSQKLPRLGFGDSDRDDDDDDDDGDDSALSVELLSSSSLLYENGDGDDDVNMNDGGYFGVVAAAAAAAVVEVSSAGADVVDGDRNSIGQFGRFVFRNNDDIVVPYNALTPSVSIYMQRAPSSGGGGGAENDIRRDDVLFASILAYSEYRYYDRPPQQQQQQQLEQGCWMYEFVPNTALTHTRRFLQSFQPVVIEGHPWFTASWRLRHADAVSTQWQRLEATIDSVRARYPSGNVLFQNNDNTYWLALRRLRWLLDVLRTGIIGVGVVSSKHSNPYYADADAAASSSSSVVYEPKDESLDALFACTVHAHALFAVESKPIVDAVFHNVVSLMPSIDGNDAGAGGGGINDLIAYTNTLIDSYVEYLNAALRVGNTTFDVLDALKQRGVLSPVFQRMKNETKRRNAEINAYKPSNLVHGYSHSGMDVPYIAQYGPVVGRSMRFQIEYARSYSLCNCASAQTPNAPQHDAGCLEVFWSHMPLPYIVEIVAWYRQHDDAAAARQRNTELRKIPPEKTQDDTLSQIYVHYSCNSTYRLSEKSKAAIVVLMAALGEIGSLVGDTVVSYMIQYSKHKHTDTQAAAAVAAASGASIGLAPRAATGSSRKKTKDVESIGNRPSMSGMEAYRFAIDARITAQNIALAPDATFQHSNPVVSLLLGGVADPRDYRNDAYCIFEAFDTETDDGRTNLQNIARSQALARADNWPRNHADADGGIGFPSSTIGLPAVGQHLSSDTKWAFVALVKPQVDSTNAAAAAAAIAAAVAAAPTASMQE